jgi:small subunit ribosomal protein S4
MARYTDSVCRLCRREGLKLFLKGDRCYSEKCAIERREYAPGQHGQGRRGKASEYATHLREKQKVRQIYGLLERQFRNTFEKAASMKGVTGTLFLQLLESRVDNLVYRFGFANSRSEARMLVSQNHFLVNKKRMNIPSAHLNPGDVIEVREKSKKATRILAALEAAERRGIPEWLLLDKEKMSGEIKAYPSREQLTLPMNENLVVEYYSK